MKVVITDSEYADNSYEKAVFKNYEQIELVSAQCRTEDDVVKVCHDADALISQYAPLSQTVINKLERCKVITRYGVGVDTIDLDAATKKGICVANVPDYCVDEVSDHALALLLSWARKITLANKTVKNGHWDFKMTTPIFRLRGRTIGLVGFGKIAQKLAEKVMPLGLQILAADPNVPKAIAQEKGVELVTLETLCAQSDFISIHAPLLASTQGMIGRKQFSLMKKEAIIINTSRGSVIDQEALIYALQNQLIAGAALDVLAEEPISNDNDLLRMDQVIITPHVAWYSEESLAELRTKAALGIVDVLVYGEYPKYLINHDVHAHVFLNNGGSNQRYG